MKYFLDASLFALSDGITQNEFEDYLSDIQNWEYWQKNHSEDVYILSSLVDTLSNELLYPFDHVINTLLSQFSINYIQGRDVGRIMGRIVDKANRIDAMDDTTIINCNAYSFSPMGLSDSLFDSLSLQESFVNAVLYTDFFCARSREPSESFGFFVRSSSKQTTIQVSFDILSDDSYEKDVKREFTISCYKSFDSFFRDSDSAELFWKLAKNNNDLEQGVHSRLFHDLKMGDLSELDAYSLIIQPSFYDDYSKNHYNDSPMVIRAAIRNITDTLLDLNLSDVHPLREDSGGNTKDLEVDGVKAYRREISKDGKRIHYWRCPDFISFANINEHDFFSISRYQS